MLANKRILGGILFVLMGLSGPSWAQTAPPAQDVTAPLGAVLTGGQVFEAIPALAGYRPEPRPAHMLRYPVEVRSGANVRPVARFPFLPAARWDNKSEGAMWTRAALSAVRTNAPRLADVVPRDIETWCPGYASNSTEQRQAFWVGMMSALAYYESTHRPNAVGGGNQWFGLLQIYPPTARGYSCRARTGAALTDPGDNLSCAARIMNVTVPRDRAVALHDGRWRGVAADWGPMTTASKRNAMAAWTREQSYCQVQSAPVRVLRPQARPALPELQATVSTSNFVSATPATAAMRPIARSN